MASSRTLRPSPKVRTPLSKRISIKAVAMAPPAIAEPKACLDSGMKTSVRVSFCPRGCRVVDVWLSQGSDLRPDQQISLIPEQERYSDLSDIRDRPSHSKKSGKIPFPQSAHIAH